MPNRVRRALLGVAWGTACACVAACTDGGRETPLTTATVSLPPVVIDRGSLAPVQLQVPTYEGSGQVVEPDVAWLPGGWHGWEYWMAINPFPYSNEYWENASIFVSHDGLAWSVPPGGTNPVIPPPSGEVYHNSDPDLVVLPNSDRMLLFDRAVTGGKNLLIVSRTSDGIHWTAPRTVLSAPRHEMVSPAVVVVPGRRPRLWYVNAGSAGCDARSTTVAHRRWPTASFSPDALGEPGWGPAMPTNLRAPDGWVLWHLDVIWVAERSEYWAVFPAFPVGAPCTFDDLFAARSRDGLTWDVITEPLIRHGVAWFADKSVYRSTLVYDAAHSSFKVWFSAGSGDDTWRLGYQTFPVSTLEALANRRH